jgi:hypothetical protein
MRLFSNEPHPINNSAFSMSAFRFTIDSRLGRVCSVLFLNSDRSRHPPRFCFKVLVRLVCPTCPVDFKNSTAAAPRHETKNYPCPVALSVRLYTPGLPMAPGGRYGWEVVAHGPMRPWAAIHTYYRSHSHTSQLMFFALALIELRPLFKNSSTSCSCTAGSWPNPNSLAHAP